MNTKMMGQLGELKAQYDFIKAGWEISIPIGDFCSYDFIAIKKDKILKIQVKTTEKIHYNSKSYSDGTISFKTTSRNYYENKTYTKKDCDFFYLFCLENEEGYLISVDDTSRQIILRTSLPRNNQKKGVNFADDYKFSKMINTLD